MKIRLSPKLKQMASALLAVMILGGILCLFVSYYLSLIAEQDRFSARSQGWNMAITISEAGIEEGLEQLNSNGTPLASDGWSPNGTVFWRTNTLPDGNYYTVSVDLTAPSVPVITSRSYVHLPVFAAAPSSTFFATVGASSLTATLVSRAVQVTCGKTNSSLFAGALAAKNGITLNGNGVYSDSFDSSNPAKSTNGKYDPSKYKGDFGDVATDSSIVVSLGNANIYGKLHTGPPPGGYSLGPNGGVGTHAWQAANGGGMEPGYFLQDANFTFPDTTLPNTTGYLTPQPGNIVVTTYPVTTTPQSQSTLPVPIPPGLVTNFSSNGKTITGYSWNTYATNTVVVTNHYDNVLYANNNYVSSALTGSTIVLGPNVTLVLPNGLTGAENLLFNYTDSINAGLTVYAGGTSASISGNQYINPSGFAGSLIIYCAPTVTSFTLNGNGQFTGVLVAPNANLKMNGGGNSDEDFSGSLLVNSVTLNGHFSFHYDEALGNMAANKNARYLITSWNEIL